MLRSMRRARRLGPALLAAVGALVLTANGTALGTGTVGAHRFFDTRSDPAVLCAYPDASPTNLNRFRVRGPRVDFSYAIGEVGTVRWRLTVQRSTGGAWSNIGSHIEDMDVTTGYTKTFPTVDVPVVAPTGAARIRLVARLSWFEQPGPPWTTASGYVKHVMEYYAWTLYGPDDPIRFDDIERASAGSCARRWTP